MKVFKEGQKYVITSDARLISIARIVGRDGVWAEFEFPIAGNVRRYKWRIRDILDSLGRKTAEAVAPSGYDAIFAYDALGVYR